MNAAAVSRYAEPEDSPARIEANARLETIKELVSANLAAARDAVGEIGDDTAIAAFEAFLARELRPEPAPAPAPVAPLPADLADPLVLSQVIAVCRRMERHRLAGGEHEGIKALGRYAAALLAHWHGDEAAAGAGASGGAAHG